MSKYKNTVPKLRNSTLDHYKGLLIILVVIRHVLQYSVSDEGGILTNLIWAVQMPGFMLVSGYFSARYIDNFNSAGRMMVKSAERYLMPFLSWFVLISVLLLGGFDHNPFKGIIILFLHVDGGLWFLWVIFILSIITTLCNVIISKSEKLVLKVVSGLLVCGAMLGLLIIIGIKTSLDFLGIKLILYYSIFYIFGWLIKMTENIWKHKWTKLKELVFFFCIVVFLVIVFNYDLYNSEDTIKSIILRLVSGFSGNAVLFNLVNKFEPVFQNLKLGWIGKYTLEIYTTHMFVNNLFSASNNNSFFTTAGFENFAVSLICTVLFTAIIIAVFKSNPIANYLMYGKKR